MKKIIILIPVFNDWQSLEKLIENINLKVKNINCKFSIFVINDGSTEKYDVVLNAEPGTSGPVKLVRSS